MGVQWGDLAAGEWACLRCSGLPEPTGPVPGLKPGEQR
jgi:hypothetical protein